MNELVFYSPAKKRIIDGLNPYGLIALTYCGGETLHELKSGRFPDAILIKRKEIITGNQKQRSGAKRSGIYSMRGEYER